MGRSGLGHQYRKAQQAATSPDTEPLGATRPVSTDSDGYRIFENPQNGHRESVSKLAWLWCLLFGWFYLIVAGLWGHAVVQIAIYIVIALMGGGPLLVLLVPAVWLVYAASVGSMLANRYLRQGWRELTPGTAALAPSRATSAAAAAPETPRAETGSVADEIGKLAELQSRGLLTPEEFAAQKAKVLQR